MVYRNTTIRGPAAIYQTEEGAAPLAREAGRRPPKGQQGLLIITLIALLTKTVMSWARRGYPQPGGGTHPPISRGGVLGEVLSV